MESNLLSLKNRLRNYSGKDSLIKEFNLIEYEDGCISKADKGSATESLQSLLRSALPIYEKIKPFLKNEVEEKAELALRDMESLIEGAQKYDSMMVIINLAKQIE